MLTLLTATGMRPAAWAICERLMRAQDYAGPVHWIIVDDGVEPQPVTFARDGWSLDILRPRPYWARGQNTQARNLLAGLARVGGLERASPRVAIIEDDDWYAPDWLRHVDAALGTADLVGETRARYYNLPQRCGRQLQNAEHASLSASALAGPALDAFGRICGHASTFLDIDLWQQPLPIRRALFTGHRVVGIKGFPGRPGIGMGHARLFQGTLDPSGQLLASWVGQTAAGWYRRVQEGDT